jgi:hypothetical protein
VAEHIEFNREDFINWVRQQPANKRFDYESPCGCAVAQYLGSKSYNDIKVNPKTFHITGDFGTRLWGEVPSDINFILACSRTFGDVIAAIDHDFDPFYNLKAFASA